MTRQMFVKWSLAYNFNQDENLTIGEAMQRREKYGRRDPRAGDLWCHKKCYISKQGSQLLTNKGVTDSESGEVKVKAHFKRWKRGHTNTGKFCGQESLASSKRESMDYANFYVEMEEYLNGLAKNIEPFFIKSVSGTKETQHDFEITHSKEIGDSILKSRIYIIDENKRKAKIRTKSTVEKDFFIIVIKISEYTPEDLADFQRGGIDKLLIEWDYLQNVLIKRSESNEKETANKSINANLEKQRKEDQRRIAYSMRVAGEWRVSGFGSDDKRNRYEGELIIKYLNKYHPEYFIPSGMTSKMVPALEEHRKLKCENHSKFTRPVHLVRYCQDEHDASDVYIQCRYCSTRLDSIKLNYYKIYKDDVENAGRTFMEVDGIVEGYSGRLDGEEDIELIPHWKHLDKDNSSRMKNFHHYKLKNLNFTPFEKVLLKSIGRPLVQDGWASGLEKRTEWYLKGDRIIQNG